jgi:hypothetical protein
MCCLPVDKEESVKEFIQRNLGDEVFFRLIEPFCSGVYAGDPAKLSMKAAFNRVGWGFRSIVWCVAGGCCSRVCRGSFGASGGFTIILFFSYTSMLHEVRDHHYCLATF